MLVLATATVLFLSSEFCASVLVPVRTVLEDRSTAVINNVDVWDNGDNLESAVYDFTLRHSLLDQGAMQFNEMVQHVRTSMGKSVSKFTFPAVVDGEMRFFDFYAGQDADVAARAFVATYANDDKIVEQYSGYFADLVKNALVVEESGLEEYGLKVDNADYHILTEAVAMSAHVPGLSCEIGVFQGGSSYLIMESLRKQGSGKVHIAVDPLNNFDPRVGDRYGSKIRNKLLRNLYTYSDDADRDFLFFQMEDTEFFARFQDGVPLYSGPSKQTVNEYAFVFIDGPHLLEEVVREVDFFAPRMSPGGHIVFDDISMYAHMEVLHPHILSRGFVMVSPPFPRIKAVYRKEN